MSLARAQEYLVQGEGAASPAALDRARLERVEAWGMAAASMGYVYRPSTLEGAASVFRLAAETGRSVGLRGAGRSYGDASLNAEEIVLDLSRMNRILEWDPEAGRVRVEPGVTVRQLWQHTIEDGWWPYVVPGTMFPTMGGCAAMNIHGKNNFAVGPIGDHILSFEMLRPDGKLVECSRDENPDLFHSAIGGFGMLGCFASLTLEMKRVHSGLLSVEPLSARSLSDMFGLFEERLPASDYLVGWVDCLACGASLGRGLVHQANYLAEGEDPNAAQSLRVSRQELPGTFLGGLLPKSVLWRLMKPLTNRTGVRLVNSAKYRLSRRQSGILHHQSHAEFAFLLDYVPDWKRAYLPEGLIQYQSFIPKEAARDAFEKQIRMAQREGLPAFLGVLKRHRPDSFWMSHGLDGYSLALDFKVTRGNRQRLWRLASELDRVVLEAGGRFYFAKDLTLTPMSLAAFREEERVRRFLALKRQIDPNETLQTDLYRRLFGARSTGR